MADRFKKSDLEILVSTMNRSNLDFLIAMFPFASFSDFQILVINQTSDQNLLKSDFPNVKIINSFEIGLSKSRNLALKNTTGKIALIADDDVRFIEDFDQKIVDAYNQNIEASIVTFQTKTPENELIRKFKKEKYYLKKKDLIWVLSIEITFKIDDLRNRNVIFNELFGLGSQFQDAESLYFLRRAYRQKLIILFEPQNVVIHKKESSSDEITSDRWLYAKSAGFYKRYQTLSYLLLFKILFFLVRKKFISFKQIPHKIKVGFDGIRDYKKILKSNSEHLYD